MSMSDEEDIFMVYEDDRSKQFRVLDSGCFYYVCDKKELFFFYEVCDGNNVILFNDKEVKVV